MLTLKLSQLQFGALEPLKARICLSTERKVTLNQVPADTEVTWGEALYLWFLDLLWLRKPIPEVHFDLVRLAIGQELIEYGNKLSVLEGDTLQIKMVMFADNTMMAVSGRDEYIDLRTGDSVKALPQAPIELVTYSLTSLFFMRRELCLRKPPKPESPKPS